MSSTSSPQKIRPINFQYTAFPAYSFPASTNYPVYQVHPNYNNSAFSQISDERQEINKVKKKKTNKNNGIENLFDFYNRQMLLIRDCDEKDIQITMKNPILYSQDIIVPPVKSQPITKSKNVAKTNNFLQKNKQISKIQQTSQEYQQNEALFNMKKLVQQKNAKKKKIMDDIEQKLQKLQQENDDYQKQQRMHEKELEQMAKKHQKLLQQFPQTKLYEEKQEKQKFQPNPRKNPRQIQMYMDLEEINQIINEEHDVNTQLLNEIAKCVERSRSKQRKSLTKPGQTASTGWMEKKKEYVDKNFNADKTQDLSKSKKQQKIVTRDNIGLNSTMKTKQKVPNVKIPKNKTFTNTFIK